MGTNIVKRQNDLFLGEDWKVIYDTFKNVNFKTYSFDSIKSSLINYIRENYPEQFNDWSENSEFIILIDTLAYMGESLSFRVDLNSRDNFIDTADRRESILRLAKMLSYQPKRNKAASGKLKIKSIKTTQIVRDSEGKNLQNKPIIWNDPQNPDWQEQFILVMNSAFNSSNPFGRPSKQVTKNNKVIQLYQVNSPNVNKVAKSFSASVAGENMDFEIVNPDLDTIGNFYEKHPNQSSPFSIIYQNDGSGNASTETGFFLYFKQGTLDFENLLFSNAIENRVYNYNVDNINEDDVWLTEIDEKGNEIEQWTKVPTLETIVYNGIEENIRKIYSVQTRDNDQVSIRFSNGKFGSVPKGIFRIWARQSNGLEYTISPQEIRSKNITIKYNKNTGTDKDSRFDLTIVFDLQDTIRNSATRETDDQIRERAPRVYYTQNRMTNAEDYNSFPLTIGSNIQKIKSVNRVYSGQSPFFDNYDPTKRFSSTINFGDDGIVYKEDFRKSLFETLPTGKTPNQIVTSIVEPLLQNINITSFFLDRNKPIVINFPYVWNQINATVSSSSGNISEEVGTPALSFLTNSPFPRNRFIVGGYILFQEPLTGNEPANYSPKQKWANIISISADGITFNIDEHIPNHWSILKVIPNIRQFFTNNERDLIAQQIENSNTFGLRYDINLKSWFIVDELNVSPEGTEFSTQFAGDNANLSRDSSWLIRVQFSNNEYRSVSRNLRYIFESTDVVRFFFDQSDKGINRSNALVNNSRITILGINEDLNSGKLLKKDYSFKVVEPIRYSDGFIESRKVEIKPFDSDLDGTFDIPDSFDIVTSIGSNIEKDKIVFYKKSFDTYGYQELIPDNNILVENTLALLQFYDWTNNPDNRSAGFVFGTKRFYTWDTNLLRLVESDDFTFRQGRSNLNFKYSHFSSEDRRIDPSNTNIIDTFVLTDNYNKIVKEWKQGDRTDFFPQGELSSTLQNDFSSLDNFKMMSDQIVWNNAQFTLLFGEGSLPENRAIFKVVKVENTQLTDNQIKQGVVNAIEEYFDLNNWDFGDTIYTSELIAYIHKKMLTSVAFVTILPKSTDGRKKPEDKFQIRQDFNSLPLNLATVDDILIVSSASPEITS